MHQKFILHIAFPEDKRLKDLTLYDWKTKFKNLIEIITLKQQLATKMSDLQFRSKYDI